MRDESSLQYCDLTWTHYRCKSQASRICAPICIYICVCIFRILDNIEANSRTYQFLAMQRPTARKKICLRYVRCILGRHFVDEITMRGKYQDYALIPTWANHSTNIARHLSCRVFETGKHTFCGRDKIQIEVGPWTNF